ncbi:GNAT family N-acetyltransferase [Micromonospora tulbaghiae]|uniref:GNAT family N-acetyltransferase n=1 Tax=Micromonospora tulbaghiae TaxID=479978 RepID=UPI0033FB9AB3
MLVYTVRRGLEAAPRFDDLTQLYALVYAEPPYCEGPEQVARFREGLPQESVRPGFTLVCADDDGLLVGAAYGWTMPAGRWWTRADRPPPSELTAVDKLAVMEWMVHSGQRGRGVGAEVMRRLLDGRPERWATLASNPDSAARGMYGRAGWVQVGASRLPWGPRMDLLALRLDRTVEE